ncbi:hypothetical protein JAAARDRAFT_671785 [Jaapia argillacea MUCL 33604]|uniref:Uncharacterized protein n=1 Tax=Jaapia argillacea MUCL 33604 TaxID=933084 RepID=A0A067PV19_9AGAM|nr:hypothetical protein JAAARDRAFT_671785 [Jaapia argillacea MUCL 33604]
MHAVIICRSWLAMAGCAIKQANVAPHLPTPPARTLHIPHHRHTHRPLAYLTVSPYLLIHAL